MKRLIKTPVAKPTICIAILMLGGIFSAAGQASPTQRERIEEDWRFYLRQMETNNWAYFAQIDGPALKAKFWPLLQDPKMGADPEFLVVCAAGLNNWAVRQSTLTAEQKAAYFKESFPLLKRAAEGGNWV